MIGVDTNILVRAALDDNPREANIAKAMLKKATQEKKLFISSYAILEFVWVLKVKDRSREQISKAVFNLLDTSGITIGHREIITAAIEKYAKGKADFGDYLILAEGEYFSASHLMSFDKILCKSDQRCKLPSVGMEL